MELSDSIKNMIWHKELASTAATETKAADSLESKDLLKLLEKMFDNATANRVEFYSSYLVPYDKLYVVNHEELRAKGIITSMRGKTIYYNPDNKRVLEDFKLGLKGGNKK